MLLRLGPAGAYFVGRLGCNVIPSCALGSVQYQPCFGSVAQHASPDSALRRHASLSASSRGGRGNVSTGAVGSHR